MRFNSKYSPRPICDTYVVRASEAGFAAIATAAEKQLGTKIPIIPAGLCYTAGEPWIAHINFDATIFRENFASRDLLVEHLERQVKILSGLSVSETIQRLG